MTVFIENIKVGNHKSFLPFQKGIILNNKSLQELFLYLKERYSTDNFEIQYIFTNRLNQDVIENFFSYLRGMGAAHDKPSALQFIYRLRWYLLGKHCYDMFTEKCNVEEDPDSTLANVSNTNNKNKNNSEIFTMTEILGSVYDDEMIDLASSINDEISLNSGIH